MCNNEKIIDCLFANITSIFDYKGYNYKVKKKNEEESVKVDYCFLKGTRMFKVEGNFYGGIVTGVTEKTKKVFMCNNCSFVDNFRERGVERILKYNNNNYFVNNSLKSSNVLKFNSFDTKSEKRKIETSGGDCIFYHSSFTNCIADGQGDNANLPLEGGAIYMVNSNYAKFESCIFDSCSSTGNGGGIYLNNVGHLILYSCNLSSCSTNSSGNGGGGLYFSNINYCCSISDSVFNDCHCVKDVDGYGGAISVYVNISTGTECRASSSYFIYRCSFYNCYAGSDGIKRVANTACFVFCFFKNCCTSNFGSCRGGGIYAVVGQRSGSYRMVTGCLFSGGNSDQGISLHINAAHARLNPEFMYLSFTDVTVNALSLRGTDANGYLKNVTDISWNAFVSSSGTDNEDCIFPLDSNAQCSTVYYVVRNGIFGDNYFSVYLNSSVCNNDTRMITVPYLLTITITSTNNNNILSIDDFNNNDPSFFCIDSGKLTLDTFTLSVNKSDFNAFICKVDNGGMLILKNLIFKCEGDYSLQHSFFSFSTGTINFNNVTCCDISFNDCSLFECLLSSSFSFSNTSFINISKNNGNGSVFNINVESDQSTSLDKITFKRCCCSNGNGGAICASLSSPSQLSLSESSFEGCTASGYGNSFFIICSELKQTAQHLMNYPTAFNITLTKEDTIGIVNITSTDYIPLTKFFLPEYLYVNKDSTGLPQDECGFEYNHCISLQIAFDRIGTGSEKKIIIVGTFIISEEVILSDYCYYFKSNDDSSKLETNNKGRYSISVDCSFLGLSFNIPSEININNYFDATSDKEHIIIFENCDFVTSGNAVTGNCNYFNLHNFSLNLTNCDFYSTINNNKGKSSNSIQDITINQPFIYLSSNGLILNKSNFTGFKCLDSSSSVITIMSGNEVEINNSSFISCKTENGCGGVIKALVGNSVSTDRFIIGDNNDVTFSYCDALKGGAFYLRIEDYNPEYLLKNIIFNNNNAKYGNNFFIEAYNLPTVSGKIKEGWEDIIIEDLPIISSMGMILDESNDSNMYPLYVIIGIISDIIYVNDKGYNNNYCGFNNYPCSSFEAVFNHYSDKEYKLLIKEGLTVNGILTFSSVSYSISGATDRDNLYINGGSFIVYVNSEFSSLDFSILSIPSSSSSLFDIKRGEFSLSFCTFAASSSTTTTTSSSSSFHNSGYLDYNIFNLDGGKMKIENSVIDDMSFSSSFCGFYINTSDDNVECSFKNLSSSGISVNDNPYITIIQDATTSPSSLYSSSSSRVIGNVDGTNDPVHSFTFDSCSFSDITSSSSSLPSLISPLSSLFIHYNLSIINSSIMNCVSENSVDGGAIKVTLGEDCFCNIDNSVAKQCSCNEQNGRGGFLFVDAIYQESSIPSTLSPLSFSLSSVVLKNNKGRYGRDIFIRCYSINKQINPRELMNGLVEEGSGERAELEEGMIELCDLNEKGEEKNSVDLITLIIPSYTSFFIYISSVKEQSVMNDECGSKEYPCERIEEGVKHIKKEEISRIGIMKRGKLRKRVTFKNMNITSIDNVEEKGIIDVDCIINEEDEKEVISIKEKVKIENIIFMFSSDFSCSSSLFTCYGSSYFSLENVSLGGEEEKGNEKQNYNMKKRMECNILRGECKCNIYINYLIIKGFEVRNNAFIFGNGAVVCVNQISIDSVNSNEYSIFYINDDSSSSDTSFNISTSSFTNISSSHPLIFFSSSSLSLSVNILYSSFNFTSSNFVSNGALALFNSINSLYFNTCSVIMGIKEVKEEEEEEEREDTVCEWEEGMIVVNGGKSVFEEMSFDNCSNGGIVIKEGGESKIIDSGFYSSPSLLSTSSCASSSSSFTSSSLSSSPPPLSSSLSSSSSSSSPYSYPSSTPSSFSSFSSVTEKEK